MVLLSSNDSGHVMLFTHVPQSLWLYPFSFVHPFPFYQNSPTLVSRPEVIGSDRKKPGFSLSRLCYLYSLVKVDAGFLDSFSALMLLVGSFDP